MVMAQWQIAPLSMLLIVDISVIRNAYKNGVNIGKRN